MKNSTLIILMILSLGIGGCTLVNEQKTRDVTERNKALILKVNEELFHNWNFSYPEEAFAIDYVYNDYITINHGGGPRNIQAFLGNYKTAFPDIHVIVEPLIAEDDIVAWVRTCKATHQGDFFGWEPTNHEITWRSIFISVINEDGKIIKEYAESNLTEILFAQKGKRGMNLKIHY